MSTFETKSRYNLFGSPKIQFTVYGYPHIFTTKHRFAESSWELLSANLWMLCSGEFHSPLHGVHSGVQLHCSREQWYMIPAGSSSKLNALNRVWPSKKNLFLFLFLIVFYWWRNICRIWLQSQFCSWLYFTWYCWALKKPRKL